MLRKARAAAIATMMLVGGCAVHDVDPIVAMAESAVAPSTEIAIEIEAASAETMDRAAYGATYNGSEWQIGYYSEPIRYPIHAVSGDVIVGGQVYVRARTADSFAVYLEKFHGPSAQRSPIAYANSTEPGLGKVVLPPVSVFVERGTSYSLAVYGFSSGDKVMNAEVTFSRPIL